ncbi:MAG: FAD-dependent monooxygenase [Gemmatimonadota bacterium]|nr:FAD-dependent monooxygenase [Gemmatimonadota bacterium]HEU4990460.1 FAD-dependent monooxygenase [Gemmatimonadaceae bacterium]
MNAADVIVVGGGPAGASAAHALASANVDVLVLDRARFPRPKPCAECLSPEASRILHRMGALEALERAGAPQLAGMVVRAPNGAHIRGRYRAGHGFRAFRDRGLSVRREVLDHLLLQRAGAAGARVHEGARVVDLLRDGAGRVRGVIAMDGDGRRVAHEAALVIGADGLNSVVAARLGLRRRLPWPRRVALVAHYRGVTDVSAYGEMHVARDGYVGIADAGDGLTTVAAVFPQRAVRDRAGDRAAFLAQWLRAQPHLAPRFAAAQAADEVRAVGPFASHARRAWAPGALLAGDAADFFDPFTGEGIYAALRGGELAAEHARAALAAPSARKADAALAAYHFAYRREFRGKWAVERAIGAVVANAALIDRAAAACERDPALADLLVGVCGDFVPPRALMRPSVLFALFARPARAPRTVRLA